MHSTSLSTSGNALLNAGLVLAAITALIALYVTTLPHRSALSSVEVNFIEKSAQGLGIVPASCASSPSYYHYNLTLTADNHGVKSQPGETADYGYFANYGETRTDTVCDKNGCQQVTTPVYRYICVNNSSANSFFIPGHTINELESFRARRGAIPGLDIY
jgi:hypothetical protein